MYSSTIFKFIVIFTSMLSIESFAQDNLKNILTFKTWQVQYYTPITAVTSDEENLIWSVLPPIVLNRQEVGNSEGTEVSAVKIYMQGIEGLCSTFQSENAAQKGIRYIISTSVAATLYESYISFNGGIRSNIYAILREWNNDTCLKLYFYNANETNLKISFSANSDSVGSQQIKSIVKTAKPL